MVKKPPANAGDPHEMQVQSLGWEDSLKEEMATHSSILAEEIPWPGEPGGLQSMGLRKNLTQLGMHTRQQPVLTGTVLG